MYVYPIVTHKYGKLVAFEFVSKYTPVDGTLYLNMHEKQST